MPKPRPMTTRPLSLYLAGPMTGMPDFNYPAFNAAAKRLRADPRVAQLVNPAERFNGRTDLPHKTYIRAALQAVKELYPGYWLHADHPARKRIARAIALLPGWTDSPGAIAEVALAKALGYAVLDAETLLPLDVTLTAHVWNQKAAGKDESL